jgi:hypothetical protein
MTMGAQIPVIAEKLNNCLTFSAPHITPRRNDHDRFGSRYDPSLNGHLHYPNDIDKSLNEVAVDKIRKYRADYNNNPPSVVSFMVDIGSTSGRLHSEFIWLLFLQAHRETDLFFAGSRVQLAQPQPWTIPLLPYGFLDHPERKSRQYPHQGYSFTYYTQYWWGSYHFKNTYSPITLANISSINLVLSLALAFLIHNKQIGLLF